MSVALELWRTLEAWDAKVKRWRIDPPAPGAGRFMPSPGGGSRPSLADVVRGTVAGGPKRLRGDRGGTVADAVRAAARLSDSTGRPTHRPPAERRAHGAHDVADEVDRALADAGVSEDVRRQVAGRARAAADSHGPRPDSLPRAAPSAPAVKPAPKPPALSDAEVHRQKLDAAVHFGGQDKHLIMIDPSAAPAAPPTPPRPSAKSYEADLLEKYHGAVVDLSDFEDSQNSVGAKKARARVVALKQEMAEAGVSPTSSGRRFGSKSPERRPEPAGPETTWTPPAPPSPARAEAPPATQTWPTVAKPDPDKTAKFKAAMAAQGITSSGGPIPTAGRSGLAEFAKAQQAAPARPPRAPKALAAEHVADVSTRLAAATSRDEAHRELAGLTAPQLRQVAAANGVAVGAKHIKARIADDLVEFLVGRRLNFDAIRRMASG